MRTLPSRNPSILATSKHTPSSPEPTQTWLASLILILLFIAIPANSLETVVTVTVTATATATATATPTAPNPPSYTSPQVFKDAMLSVSNTYRAAHNASNLVWNDTLSSYAQDWAQASYHALRPLSAKPKHALLTNDPLQKKHGPYGENLAYGYANASAAVEAWGDECLKYNFEEPTGFTEATGHFTQLVWRATKEVGCAAVDCGYASNDEKDDDDDDREKRSSDDGVPRAQGWYVVCEYTPAGNVVGGDKALGDKGFFKLNVQASSTYSDPYGTSTAPTQTQTAGSVVAVRRPVGYWAGVVVVVVVSTVSSVRDPNTLNGR
ncbi:hypothetical protein P175DRAFT_0522502 [Aspergillus ochraceoroseus IBT 24754]|uniref:SCP domain-containing protein n=1 Tax=Aspergillus ochraceoroseus IBT 24754 TaxID=1392256 RepID=A0A2T5M4P3_9EURO|nr:uncharacterized protein P175DRAFT_0522502 [Aspergillus ochraceoroseus IBT 24754]PTU23507.1 hypothetical protein P175DRAFT_0522502 [Aspergillus ochraceoroseus IBT 24754]